MFIGNIVILIVLFRTSEGSARVFTLPLYKQKLTDDIERFKDNALQYYISASNFYKLKPRGVPVAKIDQNVNYIGNIQLGYPSNRFIMKIDTSFSSLWVVSQKCYFSEKCLSTETNKYDHEKSLDYEADMVGENIQYRSIVFSNNTNTFRTENEIYVELGFDTFKIDDNVRVHGMHLMEATSISKIPFNEMKADGVLGLGFPHKSLQTAPPFHTMLDRGVLNKPIFSLFVGQNNESGEIIFGGSNLERYHKETLVFHKLISEEPDWIIKIDGISMKSEELCKGCNALIDTGTALIAAPKEALSAIYRLMGLIGTVPYQIPEIRCNNKAIMPDLQIKIGEQLITLMSNEYIIELSPSSCVVGFMESPTDFWIFGNLFLSKVYTIFDVGRLQIGFAHLTVNYPGLGGTLSGVSNITQH